MERNAVNWFEIPVTDMERAKKFYHKITGREAQDMPPMGDMQMAAFPMHRDAPYATGALVKSDFMKPQLNGTMVYFTCDDCATTAATAKANGGEVLLPKTSLGEFGFMAHIKDSEGNKIGLHSEG